MLDGMPSVSEPTAEEFRGLARSSPRAWSTIRFLLRSGPGAPIRAWIARPDRLRVESHLGEPLRVESARSVPRSPGASVPWVRLGRVDFGPYDARTPGERPDDAWWRPEDTVPQYQDYRWVAMLEPLELADSWRDPDELPGGVAADGPPVEVHRVDRHRHHGRSALAAEVSTRASYDPRCSCCPLLRSADALVNDGFDRSSTDLGAAPTRFLVVLDEGSGVCVAVTELDGADAGAGFDVAIEEVDEPYDDALFAAPHRRHRWHRRGHP